MGLLDNLFKPKPDSSGERIAESSAGTGGDGSSETRSDADGAPDVVPKPPQFLAPKNYVPRSSLQIVPPTRGHPQPEHKAVSPEPDAVPQMAKEIVLTLGDVLSQIPFHFLRQGMWDVRRELRFPAEGLAADIARGRALVSLTDIVAQCPAIFVTDAEGLADVPIRLPLQKLVEQIGITTPAAYAAAQPVATTSSEALVPAVSDNPPMPVAATSGIASPKISFSASASMPAPIAEAQIHLGLAAILKRCPPEIIVRPLPRIDESVRVTFSFAPIERQLASGRVEVSSLRFIAALPLELMKYFEAHAGVKVPLPIEEIFQNLPHPMPVVSEKAEAPLPIETVEHTDAQHESEARLATPTRTDVPYMSVESPPTIGAAGPVKNSAPSVDMPLQSPISWAAPAPSVEALIRTGTDSRVPEAIFAELQPVDLSGAPVLGSERTMSAALALVAAESEPPPAFPSSFVTSPIELVTPPNSAEHAEVPPFATEATGSELPQAILSIAQSQVRPIVVQPPPIFVTAITSEVEGQLTNEAQTGTDVVEQAVEQRVESITAKHESSLVEVESQIAKSADVASAEDTAEPAEPEIQESAISRTAPNSETREFVENEMPGAAATPLDIALELDGRVASLLGTEAPVDLLKVSQLLATLPGIQACIVSVRNTTINGGDLPVGFNAESIRELGRRMHHALDQKPHAFPASEVGHLTLHAARFSLSLFIRGEACVCAVHRARVFLPGVREKFAAVADELGRLS